MDKEQVMDNDRSTQENSRLANIEISEIISDMAAAKIPNDVLTLARADLEYGYSETMVKLYVETNWGIDRMRVLSKIIGKTDDMDFIDFIRQSQFTDTQMEALLDFHLKGAPLETIIDVTGQKMSDYATHMALSKVVRSLEQVKDTADNVKEISVMDKHVTEVLEHISNKVSGLEENKQYMEQVLTKLQKLDQIQGCNDDVKEAFTEQIDSLKALVDSQQSQLNQSAKELAEKNSKISSFVEAQESLQQEVQSAKKEVEILRGEKEEMNRKMDGLVEEIAGLEIQLEQANSVTEQTKVEEPPKVASPPKAESVMPEHYQAQVISANGSRQMVQVERTVRHNSNGLLALAGRKLFGKRGDINLISHLKNASLNPAQMQQVKVAIESGLLEEEVVDIINSGFAAEEMAQAIEIVLAEKRYS